MKSSRNYFHSILVLIGGLALGSAFTSHAQLTSNQIANAQLVSSNAIPQGGATFWSWQKQFAEPPLPFDPFPLLPLYTIDASNTFIYDDSAVSYETLRENAAAHLALQKFERQYGLETNDCGTWCLRRFRQRHRNDGI